MAGSFCPTCGVALPEGTAFCPNCGKGVRPIGATAGSATGLQSNVAGALSYVLGFITGILFLVVEPYKTDRFVRFHAFQSIFLSIAWVLIWGVLELFMGVLPFAMWRLIWTLTSLVSIAFFLLWLFLMYKAYSNQKFMVPIIGPLAEKQA